MNNLQKPNVMTVAMIGVGLVGIAFYVHRKIVTLQTDVARLSEATMKTVKHVSEMNGYGSQIQELSGAYKNSTKVQKSQVENTTMVYDEVVELRKNLESLIEQLETQSVKVALPKRKMGRLITKGLVEKKKSRKSRKYESESESESDSDSDSDDDEDVGRVLSRVKRS